MLYLRINNTTSHQLCEDRSKPSTGAVFRTVYLDKHTQSHPTQAKLRRFCWCNNPNPNW